MSKARLRLVLGNLLIFVAGGYFIFHYTDISFEAKVRNSLMFVAAIILIQVTRSSMAKFWDYVLSLMGPRG